MCNKTIKFGAFAHYAFRQGTDYIATGHYARIVFNAKNNEYNLLKGIDANKDQSYFLYAINKEHLSKILFPIGDLTKPEVRKIAKKIKLPNALRKDSQGICFLGMIDMQEFLSHYISTKRGNVLDTKGNTIGYHPGSLFFTIGERHGFTITKKGNNDSPLFVIHKDNDKNTITVDNKVKLGHEDTDNSKLSIAKTNWLSNNLRINNLYDIRLRYRQEMMKGSIVNHENDNAVINISRLSESYASGQSLVVYDGNVCLGGGIID
jgi:tRNA-specific 2-thiouridylase